MTKEESRCDGRHGTREVEGTVMVSWNMECWKKKQVRGREQFKKKKNNNDSFRRVGGQGCGCIGKEVVHGTSKEAPQFSPDLIRRSCILGLPRYVDASWNLPQL